ncbi:MAG: hypothetical protein WAM13_15785 [Candidatus Sulfotelmatobacter sp.]
MAEAAIMKTIHLLVGSVFSGLALAVLAATAQEAPTAAKEGSAGPVTVERDKEKEDHVAKLFEGIRAEAGLPQLKRIRHRADLEQGVCTSALTGKPSKQGSSFYITSDPESITPELKKIASLNRLDSNKRPWYERYSVAVWRVKNPTGGEVAYRVGVGIYGTALGEFVDCHFTDDVYYCGNWKKSIARPCRGK